MGVVGKLGRSGTRRQALGHYDSYPPRFGVFAGHLVEKHPGVTQRPRADPNWPQRTASYQDTNGVTVRDERLSLGAELTEEG